MAARKQNSFLQSFIYSKLYLLIGLFLIVLLGFFLAKEFINKRGVDSEITNLKGEIQKLEGSNVDLKKLVQYLGSDDYVKQEAKLKFGYREAGEQVVVISDQNVDQRKFLAAVERSKPVLSNPEKWMQFLFH